MAAARLGVAAIVRFATAGVLAVAASGFAAAQNAADVGPASGPLVGGSDPKLTANSADPGAIWQPTPGGPGSSEKPLEILLAPRPPFAFKDELGQWDGLSISLWREIAERLQIEFVLVETTLEQVVRAVREGTGSTIIGVAITPERAKSSFLTHAFESSGVGIATRERIGLLPSVSASLEWMEVLQLLLLLILLFFIAAVLIWICERRHEVRHFHPKASRGIPDGMWWSVVTFATIGYGDKVPQTVAGRIVAATWILFSVVLVALFTGIIASRITLTAGAYVVTGADDLGHKRVGRRRWHADKHDPPANGCSLRTIRVRSRWRRCLGSGTSRRLHLRLFGAPLLRGASQGTGPAGASASHRPRLHRTLLLAIAPVESARGDRRGDAAGDRHARLDLGAAPIPRTAHHHRRGRSRSLIRPPGEDGDP